MRSKLVPPLVGLAHPGPCYIRLGKAGEPDVHAGPIDFQLGKAIPVRDGKDVTLISTGGMLKTAVGVARRLEANGLAARVLSMHTLKPLDTEAVLAAAHDTGAIVTLEQHSVIGGLGSMWGTLAGGVILGVAQAIGAQIDPGWQVLAGHLAFLLVLALRPEGLFPRVHG